MLDYRAHSSFTFNCWHTILLFRKNLVEKILWSFLLKKQILFYHKYLHKKPRLISPYVDRLQVIYI